MGKEERLSLKELSLEEFLEKTAEEGIVHVPNLLGTDMLSKLQKLCHSLEYDEIIKKHEAVKERYFVPTNLDKCDTSVLTDLAEILKTTMSAYSDKFPVLEHWNPNDFAIQLYDGYSYITSHKDPKINKGLIVVFTIQGRGVIEASHERGGEPFTKLELKESDTVLLRGAGLKPDIKGHPGVFHTVSKSLSQSPRISIGFRQK